MKFSLKLFVFALIIIKFSASKKIKGNVLFVSESKNVIVADSTSQSKISDYKLNTLYSDKQLGSFVLDQKTIFRLFAPTAKSVELITFNKAEENIGKTYNMTKDSDGVWEISLDGKLFGLYYGYKISQNSDLNGAKVELSIDPYAKAVTTFTDYFNPRKAIVYNDNYNWENDEWIQRDWRDLTIYEMHIRDLTAHKSSEAKQPGTYKGLIEKNIKGGINHIKDLGVNTVELLPAQEFGYVEIPYKDSLNGSFNTWNPYERNHWGYMTSNFFAPSAYYSENTKQLQRETWIGSTGRQVKHFKDMVKAFHKDGIAVMMDVVYNHLSEYELGNLKQIDKEYYFQLDDNGNYIAESYCGNDLKTERPMLRKLIIDSIIFWMKEYHIDGFRFDLGKLIDWETIEAVIHEAKKINPHVVFVCEPWGGGYDPKGFSLREWGSWNDQIRNGIKGENPFNGLGWIFGNWYNNNNFNRIKSYVRGTLISEPHGLFQKSSHSVNYLEAHDGYTLGDFIRLGIGKVKQDQIITDVDKNVELSDIELKLHKLASMFLFTSQGITMIHSGQEFARSKVIAHQKNIEDEHAGMLDHNSYNKDNETNYLNYEHAEINKELVDYYKGLIKLRSNHEAFRRADFNEYKFYKTPTNKFALSYLLTHKNKTYFVAFNSDKNKTTSFNLPKGWWGILADENKAMNSKLKSVKNVVKLKPTTGIILKLK
ncbi:MAG: pullulanase [Ignavibacteriae bacterium]|nr:pullulanase [Ignavibacteriota bacterium]